jgi:hypothetical protein
LHDRQRRAAPLRTGASMKKKKVGTYEESDLLCNFFQLKILPQKSYERRTEILQNSKNPQKATKKLLFFGENTKKYI